MSGFQRCFLPGWRCEGNPQIKKNRPISSQASVDGKGSLPQAPILGPSRNTRNRSMNMHHRISRPLTLMILSLSLTAVFLLLCGCGGGSSTSAVVQPPAALSYTTATAVYTQGTAITANNPTSTGGAVASYSVSPALPAGLSLNTSTGIIDGTPTAVTSKKEMGGKRVSGSAPG